MGSLKRVRAFVVGFYVVIPGTAMGHTYIMQPPARDATETNLDARAHKSGPCGGVPRTNVPTQYKVGEEIEVKWQETIDHEGCFQVAFSPGGDKDWVTLLQMDDPAGSQDDRIVTAKVKLPAGVSCKDCTLVVRQLMIGKECATDAAPNSTGPGDTYFSCADIRVGDFPDAGPTLPSGSGDEDGGTGSSSGVSTTPTDGGGKTGSSGGSRRLSEVDAGDTGCNVALGGASGFSLFASVGLGALALVRRRRRAQ